MRRETIAMRTLPDGRVRCVQCKEPRPPAPDGYYAPSDPRCRACRKGRMAAYRATDRGRERMAASNAQPRTKAAKRRLDAERSLARAGGDPARAARPFATLALIELEIARLEARP